jgi:hypothetical protein
MTRERFNEGSSGEITGTITDAAGQAVPAGSLTAATLTLYDLETYVPGSPTVGIINDRDGQDVLSTTTSRSTAAVSSRGPCSRRTTPS